MTPIFIRPACRLALRPGIRAYCLNSPKPSAYAQALSTLGHAARSGVDQSSASKSIPQMRTDLRMLQIQVKELRRSIYRARRDRVMESVEKSFNWEEGGFITWMFFMCMFL
ncbi:hypothetical protein B9Z19DRAFT_1121321 [Tuber borchii]|uniref:Uncharacterized protein n=1 Tax=Tuber borchii TaxID=42251 RepID=A0A2T7A2Y0_TUBBO|nr:hypothetical protein B9Z19DRAFT_1121321 [Tuber borchii]